MPSGSFQRIDPAYLALVFDHMPSAAIAIDVETFRPVAFNDRMCELVGYGPDELWTIPLHRYGDDGAQNEEDLHALFQSIVKRGSRKWRSRLTRKDGSRVVVDVALGVEHARDDHVYAIAILTDVSDALASEQALREKERLLDEAQALAGIGSWSWDLETGRHVWSEEMRRLFGRDPADVAPTPAGVAELLHPDHRARFLAYLGRCDEQQTDEARRDPGSGEFRILLPDGTTRLAEGRSTVLRDERGRAIRTFGTIQDITERRRLELERERLGESFASAQRFDAVGRLARGIAHDFNNVLGAIMNFATVAKLRVDETHELLPALDGILSATDRARLLIENLLQNGRPHEEACSVSLGRVIRESLPVIRAGITPRVRVSLEVQEGHDAVRISPTNLERLLFNLAANAADAMQEGGELRVSVVPRSGDASAPGRDGRDREPRVDLIIEDTGSGIPEAIRPRIFEPYFSTKAAEGQGTGLGLFVVASIVQEHGGRISIESEVDRGTRVEISLPTTGATETLTHHESTVSTEREERARILLVDDDDAFCGSGLQLLEALGHRVRATSDPERVMELLESDPRIDTVITDLTMPGTSGLALAKHVRARRPDVRVFLSTGFSDIALEQQAESAGIDGVLHKPWRATELSRI